MTTLKSMEKNRNFEFLYLCILLIISRMRDDIDKFNENFIRMASNNSIYYTGNKNTQNSPTKISDLTLDLKKTKSSNLNNSNAIDYFNNNITSRNLSIKFENFTNNNQNNNLNYKNLIVPDANKLNNDQINNLLLNKTNVYLPNDSSKILDNAAEGKSKEKKQDFSFTNQIQSNSADNELNVNNHISRSTMANNNLNTTNSISGSKNHLLNGYTNINRISPNINSTLNQAANKNPEKLEMNNINHKNNVGIINSIASNENENNKNREKYLSIKDYFENNESKGICHFNSIANKNNNNNEKIILDKNKIRNFTNDSNDNSNSHRVSNENEKNIKEKENDIANYFSKKPASNKKNHKNISLLNLRKGKEKDIDRESIFSMRNNLNFDYNKSPVLHASNSSSYYNLLGKLVIWDFSFFYYVNLN